jgi:PPOX class probable F420-dependent enzyme
MTASFPVAGFTAIAGTRWHRPPVRAAPADAEPAVCQDEAMDIDAALEFIASQHNAVLATLKADDTPQLSPVTIGVDDAGYAVISTRQTAYKVRHIRRDPRVWLCALPDRFYGSWVQLSGTAEIVELPEAMDGLVDYYRRISGEHPDWDDYRAAMVRDQRVLLRITVTKAGPSVSG